MKSSNSPYAVKPGPRALYSFWRYSPPASPRSFSPGQR